MALNVGVNVTEVDGPANPTIQPAPTSVAAFVGLTERGVLNAPVHITSLQQFRSQFGTYRGDSFLAYAVDGFFLNGGQNAYILRVAGAGSNAASFQFKNRQSPTDPSKAGPALRIAAGTRGQEDPGRWGERLLLDIRDDAQGNTTLSADSAANSSSVQLKSLDGIQVGSVLHFLDATDSTKSFYRKVTKIDTSSQAVSWSNTTPITSAMSAATVRVTTMEFRIIVYYHTLATASATMVEDWHNLSMENDAPNYVVNVLNSQFTGSRYITVTDLSGNASSGEKTPALAFQQVLQKSTENAPAVADYLGDAGLKTGLFALDTTQIQLLALPDLHLLSVDAKTRAQLTNEVIAYCEQRNDCMFVGSTPDRGRGASIAIAQSPADYNQLESDYLNTINDYASVLQANKVFGALYAPWVQVFDPIGVGQAPTRFIPSEGHVMGIYARTDRERGIWKAPAGNAAQVLGALDLAATFTATQLTYMVQHSLVNGIVASPGAGIIVATSRTLSSDTRWWFVNVRLLFNFVKSSLLDALRFIRQEPNTEALRTNIRTNVVRPFLLGLWRQGAFGSDPPDKVFSIKCDAENNPPSEVSLGNFKLEVYFYAAVPAEVVRIIVGQQPSGGSAKEA